MSVKIDVNAAVRDFALSYLKNNPNANEMQVQAATRDHIQELSKTAKISKKQLATIQPTVTEVFSQSAQVAKANSAVVTVPKAKQVLTRTNAQEAEKHYQQFQDMSKTARQKLHNRNMQDAKAAFATPEYDRYLLEKHPELYEAPEKKVSNNQNKKQANAEYQSSKKTKIQKKIAEERSKIDHKGARSTKVTRNAIYMTEQGQLTKEAKQNLKKVVDTLNKAEAKSMPIQDFINQPYANEAKSARASFNAFVQAGLIPPKSEGKGVDLGSAGTPPKMETSAKPVAESVTKSTESAARDVATKAGDAAKKSNNKILKAVAIAGVALAAIFGYKAYENNEQQKQFEVAA